MERKLAYEYRLNKYKKTNDVSEESEDYEYI